MADTSTLVPLIARMPRETKAKIERRAADEGRSLSQMTTRLLEQALEHTEQPERQVG